MYYVFIVNMSVIRIHVITEYSMLIPKDNSWVQSNLFYSMFVYLPQLQSNLQERLEHEKRELDQNHSKSTKQMEVRLYDLENTNKVRCASLNWKIYTDMSHVL